MRVFHYPSFVFLPTLLFLVGITNMSQALSLHSDDVRDGERLKINQVYSGMGAGGQNLSPQLSWTGVPAEAKSLAITIYDPDAPTGSGWWHWVVFNIPTEVTLLEEGASCKNMPPGAVESMTDFGMPGFGGAAPPQGDKPHHYVITLWALNVGKLPLNASTPAAQVGFYLNQHQLAQATITGLYSR